MDWLASLKKCRLGKGQTVRVDDQTYVVTAGGDFKPIDDQAYVVEADGSFEPYTKRGS